MSASNATVFSSFTAPSDLQAAMTVYQTSVSTYTSVGALAILIWDILENVVVDYELLSEKRFNIPMVAYIGSRIGTLGYMLGGAIFSTAPTGNCITFDKVNTAFCPIAICCSAFLFFLRLRAIYDRNHVIIATFAIFLLGLFVATLFVPLGVAGGAIVGTQYCQDASVSRSANISQVAPLIYDTLVFFAISWRLSRVAFFEKNTQKSLKVLAFGKHLPAFTRTLLLDGQIYYLMTLLAGILVIVLNFAPGVPEPLRSLTDDPYLVIVNIMACRVYRRTRLGLIREVQISTTRLAETKVTREIVFANISSGHDSIFLHITPTPTESEPGDEPKVNVC